MIDPNKICMGCMRETGALDRCPHCGFSIAGYEAERSARVLPAGTILNGKYLLGKVIGEGGFGITYLSLDLNLQIPMAIKEYFPVGLATRDTIEGHTEMVSLLGGEKKQFYQVGMKSFSAEATNLARFRNLPGIVSVRDFFYENRTAYLVMEYIDGRSLKQYLKEKNDFLPEKDMLSLMKPILTALSRIHEAGMIHRDISPENIMLSKDGRIYLIDFGAARAATGAETKSMTVLLKHGYAPVEQYQTRGKQGAWTDIYAICATMYRILSGVVPEEAVDRMVEDKLKSLELLSVSTPRLKVSSRVSQAIQKGLSVQASNRYQSVTELMHDLYAEESELYDENESKDTGHDLGLAAFAALEENLRNYKKEQNLKEMQDAYKIQKEQKVQEIQEGKGKQEEQNEEGEQEDSWSDRQFIKIEMVLAIIITLLIVCWNSAENVGPYNKTIEPSEDYISTDTDQDTTDSTTGSEGQDDNVQTTASIQEPTVSSENNKDTVYVTNESGIVVQRISQEELDLSNVGGVKVSTAEASSTIQQSGNTNNTPMQMFDDEKTTSWQEGEDGPGIGEIINIKFDRTYEVHYLKFRLGNWKSEEYFYGNNRPRTMEISLDDNSFVAEFPNSWEEFVLEIDSPEQYAGMKLRLVDVYPGDSWDDTCISDIGIYGK